MSPANGADARQRVARSTAPAGPGTVPGPGPVRGAAPHGAAGRLVRGRLATTVRHTAPLRAGAAGEHMLANPNSHDAHQVALLAPTRNGKRAINRAIDQARRHDVQHNGHAIIRVVPTGPERTTWYECRTHGCAGAVVRDGRRYCPRCGAGMTPCERVRPDIAAAEHRARRRRSWHEHRQPRRTRRAPWRARTDRGLVPSGARAAGRLATCRALPKRSRTACGGSQTLANRRTGGVAGGTA